MALECKVMLSILRPLQKLLLVFGRLKRTGYLRISVANVSRETVRVTVTLVRRTLAPPDTGESGEAYDLEQSACNSNPL